MAAMPNPRPSNEDRIRAALWFAEHGFGVFSVWSTDPDGTCRCKLRGACDQPGKHPVPAIGFKAATTDPDRIRAMMSIPSDPNWGMLPPEGVFALDVDGEGVALLLDLEAKHGPLPATLRTDTAHGQHVFLRWPTDLPRPIGQLWGYVTRWGSGSNAGYVIGPRSVHASGTVYAPAGGCLEIATLPDAWAQSAVAPPPSEHTVITIEGAYELPEPGFAGSRYSEILRFTGSRYMRGISKEEILSGVLHVLAPRFAEGLTEPELRSRFERAWKGTPERLGAPMGSEGAPARKGPPRAFGPGMDAADLLALDLPPLRWVVPDLLPQGTTILAAPPKVGKSCLIYQIAVESSVGGDFLDRRVQPGSVLYLALEDGKLRGQSRLRAALDGRTMPRERLEVWWEAPNIGEGLEEKIEQWLLGHEDAAMVAIDTLGKVRPRSSGKQGAYEVDVAALSELQNLFRDRPAALVIVHHARKEASDDFLASVSGTYGITGSADTIILVKRPRMEVFGTLMVTGRDVPDMSFPVSFEGMLWRAAPGALPEASFERTEVFSVIEKKGPIWPIAIADEVGKSRTNVQNMVTALVDKGAVARTSKGYVVAGVIIQKTPYTPSDYSDSDSHGSHQGDRARGTDSDPAEWLVPCEQYREHQSSHRQTPEGWVCDACS